MKHATFDRIEELAQFSVERGFRGKDRFYGQVRQFDEKLRVRFTVEELRQVPEYHKLVGSTQQSVYQIIVTRAEIIALIEEFLNGLEEQWETMM